MKNLLLIFAFICLVFVFVRSILLCMDKEAELRCINNLDPDQDVRVCEGVEYDR